MTAGFSCSADGVGGHDLGEVASQDGRRKRSRGFPQVASAGEPHPAPLDAPGAHRQYARPRRRTRGESRRVAHGDHHRRLRAALRSRDGGPRGRFALLSDPPRPGDASHPRSHASPTSTFASACFPQPKPAAAETRHLLSRSLGYRALRERRRQRASGACRRRSSALLRRSARLPCPAPKWLPSPAMAATCRKRRNASWILPMSETAVIISSLQIIRVRGVERVGMYRGRPYRLP